MYTRKSNISFIRFELEGIYLRIEYWQLHLLEITKFFHVLHDAI